MLGNLSDPTTIGPAVAMSLLSSFYGVLVYLLIYILNKNIELNSSK
jgi:flagellar motor component MotA